MRIKICGITRIEDALLVSQLGAWAIGLIFVPTSPRRITIEKAREITETVEGLYPEILKIGVFANQQEDFISNVVSLCKLDGIQFHGEELPEFIDRFNCRLKIKAFLVNSLVTGEQSLGVGLEDFIRRINLYKDCLPLLDLPKNNSVSQELLFTYASKLKDYSINFIIAGGIDPDNITKFMHLHPYAVDIARGVEISPGIKDKEKLLRIFSLVKGDEANV
ncbi:MAG: phosphoribosylanthranilate isomerase [bacterium]|nr:phosphoribosylanthranilate isomerase [bacterium]